MGKRHGNDSARFARVPRSMIHSFQLTIPYGQRGVAGGWGEGEGERVIGLVKVVC